MAEGERGVGQYGDLLVRTVNDVELNFALVDGEARGDVGEGELLVARLGGESNERDEAKLLHDGLSRELRDSYRQQPSSRYARRRTHRNPRSTTSSRRPTPGPS